MIDVYLIGHLPTPENAQGLIVGSGDSRVEGHVCRYGRYLCRGLVSMIVDWSSDRRRPIGVWTSSVVRSEQTCHALFGGTDIPIERDERLAQIEYGPDYTMRRALEVEKYLDFVDRPFPGGESFRDFAVRIRSFLEEQHARAPDQIIVTPAWRHSPAVFSHVCDGTELQEALRLNRHLAKAPRYRFGAHSG